MTTLDVQVWCDGSGTHNLGPACIGAAVVIDGAVVCEASEHIGEGTNNVAELRAMRRGLHLAEMIVGTEAPITVYSDSEYAIGSVSKSWTIRANGDLVRAIRRQVHAFTFLRFVHVDGHSGIVLNERVDWLAHIARRRHQASLGAESKKPRKEVVATWWVPCSTPSCDRRARFDVAGGAFAACGECAKTCSADVLTSLDAPRNRQEKHRPRAP